MEPVNNALPPTIRFVGGPLSNYAYTAESVAGLLSLLKLTIRNDADFLFQVNTPQQPTEILGFVKHGALALVLPDPAEYTLKVIAPAGATFASTDYVEIVDPRWELCYFLPTSAFCKCEEMLDKLKRLVLGIDCSTVSVDQTIRNPGVKCAYSGDPPWMHGSDT